MLGGTRINIMALVQAPSATGSAPQNDACWIRLGYLLTAGLFVFRLWYITSGVIGLSKDEAYQWLWSKHLALSYYSKPPAIAWLQFAGTSLWGDTPLGVRFFSPVIGAILSLILLRFVARTVGARPAFLLLLIISFVPLMDAGSVLMTIDPPLVLCWTLGMVAGWRAVQPEGGTKDWLLVGMAMGLGFLSKYSAVYQIVCWALFFGFRAPARIHFKRPGPYLALLVFAICTVPVILWNSQHGWITVQHVAKNAGMTSKWKPTFRYLVEFVLLEFGLLNPVFFLGALWAMAAFWKHRRENALGLFFFCMGTPVFLGHLAFSLHSRVLANWIAPAVLPMFCLMVTYWNERWQSGARAVRGWLCAGLLLGLVAVPIMHDGDIIGILAGRCLPGDMDPQRRVKAWKETAEVVERARQRLLQEGKPAFVICDHYGLTGLFSFYLPEARRAALSGQPLVYCCTSSLPENQFYFWPEYRYRDHRRGENAIYVTEPDAYQLEKGWLWKWLNGKPVQYRNVPPPIAVPGQLQEEFESVTDLGLQEIKLGDRILRRVQLFECRNLR
jgi:hypothetical protein